MQLIKHQESSHWYQYQPDGTVVPQYDATLREARKQNLFISPTSIEKDIMANPQLTRWIKNEIAKAFVLNPRIPGETDENYATRCLLASDSVSKEARERGTRFHTMAENYPAAPTDEELAQPYLYFKEWYTKEFGDNMGESELMLADPAIGVAGRTDRIVAHPVYGPMVLDFKTQSVKKSPTFYDSFPRQLSFYAKAYAKQKGLDATPRIMSVLIDTNNNGIIHTKLYTQQEQQDAYREFLCLVWLWCRSKDYWPGKGGKWEPIMPFL